VYASTGASSTCATAPFSFTAPPFNTTMRSAICATTARSCDTYTAVVPSSRITFLKAASTSICVVTSSAVVGSSNTTTAGSVIKAIAAIKRCNWPPDT
jgi:hypothetical protein